MLTFFNSKIPSYFTLDDQSLAKILERKCISRDWKPEIDSQLPISASEVEAVNRNDSTPGDGFPAGSIVYVSKRVQLGIDAPLGVNILGCFAIVIDSMSSGYAIVSPVCYTRPPHYLHC